MSDHAVRDGIGVSHTDPVPERVSTRELVTRSGLFFFVKRTSRTFFSANGRVKSCPCH